MEKERTQTASSPMTGGCLCGAVSYESPIPLITPTLCHCQSCRRASGAHVLGLFTVPRSEVRFTTGKPAEYRSSPDVLRGFCTRCGTSLSYWHALWPENLSLTIASLDDPARASPADHTGMADAVSWDAPNDGLPQSLSIRPD